MEIGYKTMQRLLGAGDREQFTETIKALLGDFGASHFILAAEHTDPELDPTWVGGYPDEWVSHYIQKGYTDVDPVVRHALMETSPYLWPDYRALLRNPGSFTPTQVELFAEAHEAGLNGGITIPVRDRGITWGLFSVSFDHWQDAYIAHEKRWGEIIGLAFLIHESSKRFWNDKQRGTALIDLSSLTKEEVELLKHAAAGRRNAQIAGEMKISERRVAYLMRKISKTLGVGNRAGAVATALSRGII